MGRNPGELFFKVNRGKERISIDLKTPEGKGVLHQIVAKADIFMHNFRPGVPEKLGLDYEGPAQDGSSRGVVYVPQEGALRDEFGIAHCIGGYGMTEIPGVTCNPLEGPQKPGSMGPLGRHPDPGRPWAECRVVDDEGRDVPVNEVGELIVRTPIIMQGYFRDPDQTKAAFRGGWFLTGDLVRRDAEEIAAKIVEVCRRGTRTRFLLVAAAPQ